MRKRHLLILCMCLSFTASVILPANISSQERTEYSLAVVAQFPPAVIHKHWTPFIERLSKETGAKFNLKIYQTIPQFESDVMRGVPDFAFMNPYHQVMAKKAHGYIPLIRDANPLAGILVVRNDSPIKSLKDLNDKELAFPAPNAFAASLYIRALLSEKYKIKIIPRYVVTHSNVYRHVILGKTSAGGGVNHTLDRETDEVKSQLRILYETPESSSHPLSAHPRVPQDIQEAVIKTFLKLAGEKESKEMLNNIQISQPVKADYKKDYMPLERFGLEKYVVIGGD